MASYRLKAKIRTEDYRDITVAMEHHGFVYERKCSDCNYTILSVTKKGFYFLAENSLLA